MTRGSDLYLWYVKSVSAPPVPLGVTSSRAPDDLIGVYSVPIGSSGAARYGEMVSHGAAELNRLLVRYALIDKITPPWWPHEKVANSGNFDLEPPLGGVESAVST